ncbi:hypothetical protein FUAX_08880 [Fulvitalea axinellae]|uniref:SRPBCC domain-containing protein n=1 Tax=Fulvitalea axinellae TaxID=1182444 RepID=A0AAU9D6J6_9BACT|nr:hypothetical protein FUAX_08880 [Fulvitalea axinellae]
MALEIKTEILINAPVSKVWKVLTSFGEYPRWNPFLTLLEGDPVEGGRISVTLSKMTFRPRVLAYRENSEFRWRGHLLMPGIFDGEHWFKLRETESGETMLTHGETFGGVLVPVFRSKLLGETKTGFEAMNWALKTVAEREGN